MSVPGGILGVVLAGGESRRFGRDKSAEEIGGVSMIERAYRAARAVCDDVLVVSSRAETPTGPWAVVPDLRPGLGPLGGIETALDQATRGGHAATLVLACDLPLVGGATLKALVEASDGGMRVVAVARKGELDFEPLCAVYPASALGEVTGLLDGGERAAQAAYRRLGGRSIPADSGQPAGAPSMLNVNTPDDAERARRALEEVDADG